MRDGKGADGGRADLRGERPNHPGVEEHTAVRAVAGIARPRALLPALLGLAVPPLPPPSEPTLIQDCGGGGGGGLSPAEDEGRGRREVVGGRGGGGRAAAEGARGGSGDGPRVGGERRGWGMPVEDVRFRGTEEDGALLPVVAARVWGSEVNF